MTDEMFMKLLEMVQQAGEGGYALALIYLFYDYFSSILIAGTIVSVVWYIARTIKGSIREHEALHEVARIVDKDWSGEIYPHEAVAITDAVRRLVDKSRG